MKKITFIFLGLFFIILWSEAVNDPTEIRLNVNITFEVDMNAEVISAEGVHIAGSFQNWDADETEMFDPDDDGIYSVSVFLDAESIVQFRFINGNDWEEEEDVPAEFGVDDGFGGYDRQITVPNEDSTFSFIFGGAPFDNSEVSSFTLVATTLRNYPNPFNPTTKIIYSLPVNITDSVIEIFNIKGERIISLTSTIHGIEGQQNEVLWNGTNKHDKPVSSGVYLYRIKAAGFESGFNKMIFLK